MARISAPLAIHKSFLHDWQGLADQMTPDDLAVSIIEAEMTLEKAVLWYGYLKARESAALPAAGHEEACEQANDLAAKMHHAIGRPFISLGIF